MAGIYIHIPFCKTRCIYCDFFTQADMSLRSQYVEALCKEIEVRKDYLGGETINTIYFGGGTPSQLNKEELGTIFRAIFNNFDVSANAEITFEGNPDDLTLDYLQALRDLPINRLTMGIQTFDEKSLKFLQRRHNSQQAVDAVSDAQKLGFKNISIDLIYGQPNQTVDMFLADLKIAENMNIQHISAYHLIYEEGTALHNILVGGKIKQVKEETSLKMFSALIDQTQQMGFIHYETSSFGKEGYFSRHNTSYWQSKKYLGIGAAAHSYDGKCRSFNVLSIPQYINGINSGKTVQSIEYLSQKDIYNEYILTGLRTMWGINLDKIEDDFGKKLFDYCFLNAKPHLSEGLVEQRGAKLVITRKGIFLSDKIMSDLMWVD